MTPAKDTERALRTETIMKDLILRVFTSTPKALALSSPNLRAVSLWLSLKTRIKASIRTSPRRIICSHLVLDTDPKSQNTIEDKVSSVDRYWLRLVRESKKNLTAIPARIMEEVWAKLFFEKKYTKAMAIRAKLRAAKGIMVRENPNSKNRAAPKPAAELTPRVKGLARGLSNIVCMIAPLRPKIIPTIRLVAISGSLILKRMVLWRSLRARISDILRSLAPTKRSQNPIRIVIITRLKIFLFLLIGCKPCSLKLYWHKEVIEFFEVSLRV